MFLRICFLGILAVMFLNIHQIQAQVNAAELEGFFFSKYYIAVQEGLVKGGKKHAIYSYIMSNASTPGLDLFSLLPIEDQNELSRMLPNDPEKRRSVLLEFVSTKIAINSGHVNGLAAIWGGKKKSMARITTLGK